jgi:SH3-like domain-containing protein
MAKKRTGLGAIVWVLLAIGIVAQFAKGPDRSPSVPPPSVEANTFPPQAPATGNPNVAAVLEAPAAQPTAHVSEVLFTSAGTLNVRSEPSTAGAILTKLRLGTQVRSLATNGEWFLVSIGDGSRGWVHSDYVTTVRPVVIAAPQPSQQQPVQTILGPSKNEIVQLLIERSIRNYSGNCPCPYNRTASGRKCGGNSAYSRPGGASPLCYPGDVTQAMIDAFRP